MRCPKHSIPLVLFLASVLGIRASLSLSPNSRFFVCDFTKHRVLCFGKTRCQVSLISWRFLYKWKDASEQLYLIDNLDREWLQLASAVFIRQCLKSPENYLKYILKTWSLCALNWWLVSTTMECFIWCFAFSLMKFIFVLQVGGRAGLRTKYSCPIIHFGLALLNSGHLGCRVELNLSSRKWFPGYVWPLDLVSKVEIIISVSFMWQLSVLNRTCTRFSSLCRPDVHVTFTPLK